MTSSGPISSDVRGRPYFPQLDGVRALAALMVMVFHFSASLYPSRVLMLGQTGVDLFFVLSGFLISTILLQSPHGDWQEVRRFYIRRVLRIFPLYFGYLIVASLVGAGISWWFWVQLQNFPMAFEVTWPNGPPHFWSLAVEEQFYLVWPFLILFWPRRWLPHLMGAVVALSVALRILLVSSNIGVFCLTFTRMDGLAAGGLLALYYQRGKLTGARGYFAAGAILSLGLLVAGAEISHGRGLGWVQVTKYSATASLYACVLGLLLPRSEGTPYHLLASRPLRQLGRVSYGLYIYHPMVLDLIMMHLADVPLLGKLVLYLVGSYAVSAASFYGYEKRFLNWKDRLAPEKPFQTRVLWHQVDTAALRSRPAPGIAGTAQASHSSILAGGAENLR